jgi:hypothetical protein
MTSSVEQRPCGTATTLAREWRPEHALIDALWTTRDRWSRPLRDRYRFGARTKIAVAGVPFWHEPSYTWVSPVIFEASDSHLKPAGPGPRRRDAERRGRDRDHAE